MQRLQNEPQLGQQIVFTIVKPDNNKCASFYLVYSSSIATSEAVSQVYKAATDDNIKEVVIFCDV